MALPKLTQSNAQVQSDLNKIEATPEFINVGDGLKIEDKVLKPDTTVLSLVTETGNTIEMTMDQSTYVLSLSLKDKNGNVLGTTQTVDLPLESMIISGKYDATTKKIILTLKNGSTIEFSVADMVSGLEQTSNKVTSISASSTDTEYPSAKCVYDLLGTVNEALADI